MLLYNPHSDFNSYISCFLVCDKTPTIFFSKRLFLTSPASPLTLHDCTSVVLLPCSPPVSTMISTTRQQDESSSHITPAQPASHYRLLPAGRRHIKYICSTCIYKVYSRLQNIWFNRFLLSLLAALCACFCLILFLLNYHQLLHIYINVMYTVVIYKWFNRPFLVLFCYNLQIIMATWEFFKPKIEASGELEARSCR